MRTDVAAPLSNDDGDDGELVFITGTARSNKKTRTDKFGGRFTASVTLHTQQG